MKPALKAYQDILEAYSREGRLRHVPAGVKSGMLDLSTNDYLGLATDTTLANEFWSEVSQPLFTSSASRLLASRQDEYVALEQWLSDEYGKQALLFNSGYHANTGCVSALAIPGTTILADKLVHASIIDGIRLGNSTYRRFRHNDMSSLRRELEKACADSARVLVIVESIYSMDGDEAPLRELVALKAEYPTMLLYVDEAHALGVRGARGLGVCEELGILPQVDILIGTFGKACASMGAFAVATEPIRDFLLNNARSFIFSTVLPPLNASYTLFMMQHIKHMNTKRVHLRDVSRRFREGVNALTGLQSVSTTQIVPLMIGDNHLALKLSAEMQERGVLALPIRRPTVPEGTERIRFSLNASLRQEDIEQVLGIISEVI